MEVAIPPPAQGWRFPCQKIMKLGQPLIIPLADKATEFYINKIQRMLSINNKHWIVDKYGVRFVIIV